MENSSSEANKKYSIKKFPYLCTSKHLFDLFLIIGYDDDVRTKEIQKEVEALAKLNEDITKGTEGSYFSIHQNQLEASILSAVCSSENSVMLECELITRLIFPTPPPVYYISENVSATGKKYDPNQYSVVFFMNSDTLDTNSKIPFHGYSYIFYEKKEEKIEVKQSDGSSVMKSLRVYVPKAFTFISQFPYFSQFFLLANSIHELFQSDKEVEIPLEILLYNIINYTPSPINNNMNITFLPANDLATIRKNYDSKSRQNTIVLPSENVIQTKNKSSDSKSDESIGNFAGLSGYPVFDFNLLEIFNILPLEIIVEILIFNFLEIDTLFFSKNIEVLNLVMYIISALNYPCNDTIYLWHIVSVSKNELEDSSASSKFIGKPFTTMVGVNAQYDEKKIDTSQFTKAMFIADLDKKEFSFKYSQGDSNDQEDINKLIKLYFFIDKLVHDKGIIAMKNQSSLEISIRKLVSELSVKCKKVIHSNYSHSSQIIPKFLTKEVNYQTNIATQEMFYDFILNVLKTVYSHSKLVSSFKETNSQKDAGFPTYECTYDYDDANFSEEEKIFFELFQGCTKAGSYLKNFLSLHTSMDIYHIPLLFSEEFMQLKDQNELDNDKTKHFEIMDSFYIEDSKPFQFNFNEFYVFYKEELKDKVYNETLDSRIVIPMRKKVTNTNKFIKYVYQYKKIELDKEVMFRYIHYLDSLPVEKLEKIFPLISQMNNNAIKLVRYSEIAEQIELSYVKNKVFTISDLISKSIIIFYSLTVYCQTEDNFNQQFEIEFELLIKQKYCLRRYIVLSISLYYRHAMYLRNKGCNYNYLLIAYHRLIELIVKRDSVPNEELVKLIHDFEKIEQKGIDYSLYLNQDSLMNSDFITRRNNKKDSSDNSVSDQLKKTLSGQSDTTNKVINSPLPTLGETNRDSFSSKEFESSHSITQSKRVSLMNTKRLLIDDPKSGEEVIINAELIKANEQKSYLFKIKKNFCKHGFFKEDYIVKVAANSHFDGDLTIQCEFCEKQMKPRILFHHKITKIELEYELFSPLKTYKLINNQLNCYIKDYNKENLNFETMKKIMINLLFYQMNILNLKMTNEMLILLDYQPKYL